MNRCGPERLPCVSGELSFLLFSQTGQRFCVVADVPADASGEKAAEGIALINQEEHDILFQRSGYPDGDNPALALSHFLSFSFLSFSLTGSLPLSVLCHMGLTGNVGRNQKIRILSKFSEKGKEMDFLLCPVIQ